MKERKSKPPEKVCSILERVFSSLDLGIKAKQYQIWEIWEEVVGSAIAHQTQPFRVRNMILWVNVTSSTWMQQLEFMKRQIVKKLNDRMGEKLINDIRFRIGDISKEE